MKLAYAQLETHLLTKLSPIYVISGDEHFLKQDTLFMLRRAAKKAGFDERVRLTPQASADWEQLYPLLYATSLLAEKRLLEINCDDNLPNKAAGKLLEDYAKAPSPNDLLIIILGKVDTKIAKSAWYAALEKAGMAVALWPIAREQLPQWIMERAKKYKLPLHLDAANLLASHVEGNLIAASQTLEKLYLLTKKSIDSGTMPLINRDIVEAILSDESHFSVFDFIECLIGGDKARALRILDTLKNEGTEPILILWAITRELRMLAEMAKERQTGLNFDGLFQKHRIFAKRQTAIRRFLATHSLEDCWHKISQAAEIDTIIKGMMAGNAWEKLQLFCVTMV